MVNNKMFAIRKKNGFTRIVQVNKTPTGKKVYASDKHKCSGKTYRTKTMAKSALSKQKTPNSAFGRRSSKSKRFNIWNRHFVCRHPEDHTKIKVCKAANIRLNGEQYKLVQVQPKNIYGNQVIRRLTSDDHKLFKSRERANKYAKTLNVLELAKIQEISELMPTEIFTDIKNAKLEHFRGVRPGKRFRAGVNPNVYRPMFHKYETPGQKSIFHQPRKARTRPLSSDMWLNNGIVTGKYGKVGLYDQQRRFSMARQSPRIPSFGRTNYGFSRYF